MKTRIFLVFMVLIGSLQIISAQQKTSELHKNVNLRAKGLTHTLNTTKDSLLLKSDQLIYRVSFLYDGLRKATYDNNSQKLNIPLLNLERGKYTVLVYQESHIIVFGVTKNASDVISIANLLKPKKGNFASLLLNKNSSIDSISIHKSLKQANETLTAYSLSVESLNNRDKTQSRQAYRRQNLRPNGKPYE